MRRRRRASKAPRRPSNAPSQETPRSRRARLDEEKARRAAVARSGRDAEKQRVKRDEDRARKDAVARSRAEATDERARKKAEAEQLRGAVKRGKKLEPLVVDDASSYVSFDESVGTFAGGPSLDALSASPGQHTVGTLGRSTTLAALLQVRLSVFVPPPRLRVSVMASTRRWRRVGTAAVLMEDWRYGARMVGGAPPFDDVAGGDLC